MKFWNGYNVKTLEGRGWSTVQLTSERLARVDLIELDNWLNEDRPGRYFVHLLSVEDWVGGEIVFKRNYYFENDKTATLFALKWA